MFSGDYSPVSKPPDYLAKAKLSREAWPVLPAIPEGIFPNPEASAEFLKLTPVRLFRTLRRSLAYASLERSWLPQVQPQSRSLCSS